jgi:hypothetical protein
VSEKRTPTWCGILTVDTEPAPNFLRADFGVFSHPSSGQCSRSANRLSVRWRTKLQIGLRRRPTSCLLL